MVPGCGPKQQRGAAGRPGEALPPSAPPSSVLEEAPLTELARCSHGSRPSAPLRKSGRPGCREAPAWGPAPRSPGRPAGSRAFRQKGRRTARVPQGTPRAPSPAGRSGPRDAVCHPGPLAAPRAHALPRFVHGTGWQAGPRV